MSVYKQRNSRFWWVQVLKPGGGRIRRSSNTEDKAKAELLDKSLRMAYARTSPVRAIHDLIDSIYGMAHTGIQIGAIWEEYERWQKASGKTTSAITQRKRCAAVRRFATWASEHWPSAQTAEDVDRQTAAGFASWLADAGTKGKTRRNIVGDLGTVWEGLRHIREGLENPWPFVMPETRDSERGRPFSLEQESAILKVAHGGPWWLACMIARWTGLRYGDIARLQWNDVDETGGLIRIRPNKTERHKIEVVLPMAPVLANAMREAREAGVESEFVLPIHAAAYPRPERAGGPGPFALVLEAAQVPSSEFTFHSWRHTFRTRLSEAGVSDDMAKRLGGWTSDTTAARYDHASRIEEMRAAIASTAATKKPAAR
jgi:integrase